MPYLWIKALHVAAVLAFVGGLLAQSLVLAGVAKSPFVLPAKAVAALRRWDQWITTAALALVWILGMTLEIQSAAHASRWLQLKLVLVVFLSGLHGIQAGILRRAVTVNTIPPAWVRWSPGTTLLSVCAIAVLAVTKLP